MGVYPDTTTEMVDIATAMDIYDHQYLALLKCLPNRWLSTPVGSPGSSDAPKSIRSRVRIKYPQGENYHCLTHSLASALEYCGFQTAGSLVWEQADVWSKLPIDSALDHVLRLLAIAVPVIGGATQFEKCTARKRKRPLTLQQVIDSPSQFPLLLVPRTPNGVTNHGLCVVNDLV